MKLSNIVLRPLSIEDADVLAQLANNINIWNNIRDRLPHPYKLDDAIFFINLKKGEVPKATFAIEIGGALSGVIGLEIQEDVYRLSAELGYWIGEPYWGNGIASRAVKEILAHGFNNLQLERIFASTFEYNLGSMRVLEKNGFKKEGIARKAIIKNQQLYDEHRYAILKSEWENKLT